MSDTASFNGHGLATFMLSAIQVFGSLKNQPPAVQHSVQLYDVVCNEDGAKDASNHHIYLRARLEIGSAYVMYVALGFTTAAVSGDN